MDENRTQSDITDSTGSMKAVFPLTDEDIHLIKKSFSKKRKIVYYFMAGLFTIGTAISAVAIFIEIQSVNRLNSIAASHGQEMFYSVNYIERLVPFFAGAGIALILVLVLVMFSQELNIELNNNRKWIYKGVVTSRTEKSRYVGVGKNRETYYDYYIHLGDITFAHKDLYFELSDGDRIDVEVSEKLDIVLRKNIVSNRAVANVKPEKTGEFGIFDIVKNKYEVTIQTECMTSEELEALNSQMMRRLKRIMPVAVIFILSGGIACEINLWHDHYTWDQALAMRIGLWGGPIVFFGLLLYVKVLRLLQDIRRREKLIFSEKVIDKEERVWASTRESSYYIKGLKENTEVSKAVYDSMKAGDSYELHKTKIRKKFLSLVVPSTGVKYSDPDIFRTK